MKNPKPSTSVGAILVRMGCMKPEQVEEARSAHAGQTAKKLGEVMMELGFITESQLEEALAYQKRMRSGDAAGVMMEMINKRTTVMMQEHAAA